MSQMTAMHIPDGASAPPGGQPLNGGAYQVQLQATADGKLLVSGISGGGGGSGDASAAKQDTQITRETEIRDRLPAAIGPQNAAGSLAVTLASDGALVTAVGTTSAAAPADGATSGTLIGWLRAAVETLRTRLPELSSGRLPVETRHPQVYSEVVSLVGLAAGVTVYGSVIDLGAIRGQALVTALKSAGFNQSDAIAIQQSDDPLFATWTYCPRGDRTTGAVFSWTNAAGANVAVTACPSMRYARPVFVCLAGGSAQPAGASMVIGALPGGL